MEEKTGIDMRGKQDTVFMSKPAWEYLNKITAEQTTLPKRGRGRIVEDLLWKEKARREKKKAAEPAA